MMLKISELNSKYIINLTDGARLGAVKDIHIDLAEGKVLAIVLEGPHKCFNLMKAGCDIVVPWEKVKKIGVNAVLVDLN